MGPSKLYPTLLLSLIAYSVLGENSTTTEAVSPSTVASTTVNSTEADGNSTVTATNVAATTTAAVNITTFEKLDKETECLSACLLNFVVQSEKIVEHDFERTCRTYHPSCLHHCGRPLWENVAREVSDRCRFNSHFALRNFRKCYDRHTEDVVQRCRGDCGVEANLENVFVGDFCSKLSCVTECTRTSLNQHCDGAGDALEKTFYSPYDAVRLNDHVQEALEKALPELPKSCQGLYAGLGRPARTQIINDKE
ncbi:unnamed protein product [Bursaphelenchus xylophilus]|uniref:(pine wood nematode) hypothetical protein n=1 Tax=Bursaphelenchus xylophilus TaxID=6326 RepID=A0A1I7S6D1_BURXY|nr:unnamed protein product [Bursaphelenchus xylophilus]CAG9128122.1 unnamed protein product [Bursaphelenchus xylophilus]